MHAPYGTLTHTTPLTHTTSAGWVPLYTHKTPLTHTHHLCRLGPSCFSSTVTDFTTLFIFATFTQQTIGMVYTHLTSTSTPHLTSTCPPPPSPRLWQLLCHPLSIRRMAPHFANSNRHPPRCHHAGCPVQPHQPPQTTRPIHIHKRFSMHRPT